MSNYATWKNRVLETTTTVGTGDYTLGGAIAGFQNFSVIGNGNTVYYSVCEIDNSGVPSGQWETGLGTWSTGGTLARTRIIDSSSSGAAISWNAGTKNIGITNCSEKALLPDVEIYSSSGTFIWLKPNGATFVFVQVVGSGGGGGGGTNSSSPRSGGAGGAGGNYASAIFRANNLTSAVTITVANSTRVTVVGTSGESGGSTSFGTYLVASGGIGGAAGSAVSSTGAFPTSIGIRGGQGGTSVFTIPNASVLLPGKSASGGGGGGAGGANVAGITSGGSGGNCFLNGTIGGVFGQLGGAGSSGTNVASSAGLPGAGGGGGGGVTSNATAGAGGNGGLYGGGGGGGSAPNAGTGGAGGFGAGGICVVTSW